MQGTDRLTITSTDGSDGARILAVTGELDAHTASDLEASLEGLASDSDVVLDLAALDFMDSSGLRVIITVNRRLADGGGSLVLRQPSRTVQRILSVSGLEGHISVDGV